jgi:tetratricopeptide (TPR) repeat protein
VSVVDNPMPRLGTSFRYALRQKNRFRTEALSLLRVVVSGSQLIAIAHGQVLPQISSRERVISESNSLAYASAMSQAGLQKNAEWILGQYLLKTPASAEAHALLGLVKFREGEPDKSLDEYSSAARYGNVTAGDLRIVALDYVKLNDLSAAERWLRESLKRDANDWRTWRYLGGVEYSEERVADAAVAFQECLALDPENALAEDGLARSHQALGETERAGSEYRMAILWNSKGGKKSSLPFLHYGSYLRKENRLNEAIENLIQAVHLAPKDWEAHEVLGQAYRQMSNLPDAQTEVEKAVNLAPERIRLHVILARIYQAEGQKEKATAQLRIYTSLVTEHTLDRSELDK